MSEVLVRIDTEDLRNVWTAIVAKAPAVESAVPWVKQRVVGDPKEKYLIVRVDISHKEHGK